MFKLVWCEDLSFHMKSKLIKEMRGDCEKWKIVWKIYLLGCICSGGDLFTFGLESHLYKTQGIKIHFLIYLFTPYWTVWNYTKSIFL